MNNFNPITCADEIYGLLNSLRDDSVAFDLTVSALKAALQKAEEEAAKERRAASVNMAKEAMLSGEVTWWHIPTAPKIFHTFNALVESMEFYELGEEVY